MFWALQLPFRARHLAFQELQLAFRALQLAFRALQLAFRALYSTMHALYSTTCDQVLYYNVSTLCGLPRLQVPYSKTRGSSLNFLPYCVFASNLRVTCDAAILCN